MKLLKQDGTVWRYGLEQKEAMLLRALVAQFPLPTVSPAKITRNGADAKSAERERLLNESLARHREDLKRQAGKLLSARLKSGKDGWRLSVSAVEREVLLQLLNDIRVESWHALGEPEDLEKLPVGLSDADMRQHHLMHLAGWFEWKMLGEPVEGRESTEES